MVYIRWLKDFTLEGSFMPDSSPQSHTSQTPRKPHPRTRSAEPSSQQHRASRQAASNPKKPQRKKSRYIPSLDGLRALAVLAVIFYHMDFAWAKGGLLGVTVFFVLSGYLITGLLISEYDSTGGIDLPQFWLRRIRRLVPAIITVIVCVAVLCTLFNHVLLTKMRPDIVPSLFFFNNWWQIFHNVSYFEALGAPSPLTHFWSLAIEEQFYVVWPLLLLGAFKPAAPPRDFGLGCSFSAGHGAALCARMRPEPRLLRHRHARVLASFGRMARLLLAEFRFRKRAGPAY